MDKAAKTAVQLKVLIAEELLALGLPLAVDDLIIRGDSDRWTVAMGPRGKISDLNRISALSVIEKRLNALYRLA